MRRAKVATVVASFWLLQRDGLPVLPVSIHEWNEHKMSRGGKDARSSFDQPQSLN